MSIITKQGDQGTTKTLSGEVLPKFDLRIELSGCIDELNVHAGFARSLLIENGFARFAEEVRTFQKALFRLGTEVSKGSGYDNPIKKEDVSWFEKLIEDYERTSFLPKTFSIPGTTPVASAIDIVRAMIRKVERRAFEASHKGFLNNPEACIWLNRASDYFFLLAREVEKEKGSEFDQTI